MIARAPSRRRAAALLADALDRAVLHGPVNNRELLIAILREPDFLAGRSLMPVQIELASSALGERWHSDNGQRECSEILDEATA